MTEIVRIPDLLAPAGDWECARAAIASGADAIYFGLDQFNARMRARNFTEADLPELMAELHQRGVKGYVTLNTLIFPTELPQAERLLRSIIVAGVDAVIVQDIGICRLIRHLSPDFPIHGSTQMTVTSADGVEFARTLGCELVVLARESSLKDIHKIQNQLQTRGSSLPLEVFVHGALCVAYSGQCLTSEALGGRSANRGECAQACRMTYDLIVDGKPYSTGDRNYLLSPQDLAGIDVLPDLVKTGISCLKIEGRLKTPDYVATVTRVYRQALDRIANRIPHTVSSLERYELEMSFSRGLYTGWFKGINNQELVHGRFGKKRGVYLGEVVRVRGERITIRTTPSSKVRLKAGDGVVFDGGNPEKMEEGGRIHTIDCHGSEATLRFGKGSLNLKRIHPGHQVWKTSDPELEKRIRQSLAAKTPQFQRPVQIDVYGELDQPLTLVMRDELGHVVTADSDMPLAAAHTRPFTTERLQDQLSRLGQTPFKLDQFTNHLEGSVLLPISELNRLRRDCVDQLLALRAQPHRWQLDPTATLVQLLPTTNPPSPQQDPELIVLVRSLEQLQAVIDCGIQTLYCELEDPRAYRDVVQAVRDKGNPGTTIWVAPPRISKPGESWILKQVLSAKADGYLVRNYDQLTAFRNERCIGDFSLNVANPLTAAHFKTMGHLERVTASYDLNGQQLEDLLMSAPPDWFEITIHQHMPMFHMEHCVFCTFLSTGTDFTNCGRPCETHEVKLRDRVGTEHRLQADTGCRNTVFNGRAQTGAEYVQRLIDRGARYFRLEFLQESPEQVCQTIRRYQSLLQGQLSGSQLWRDLKLLNQLGVTRGSVGVKS